MEPRIKEGFPNQRLVAMPANVLERCRALPVVRDLHVTNIGCYPSAPHHYVDRENGSPDAILHYCLAGGGTLQLGGAVHNLRRGHVMVIPPNMPHIYQADRHDPWSVFWIHFAGGQVSSVLESLGTDMDDPLLYVPDTQAMRSVFEDAYACLNYHYSDAGLQAMSSEALRLFSKIKLHRGHTLAKSQSAEKRVADTLDFMAKHLDMPLTLQDLADHAGQSVPHYSKLFRRLTDQSPMAYFIQMKVRRACELLDQTRLDISHIAAEVGYHDPHYFSRLFRKVQGCSPSAYRQTEKG